MDNEQTIACDLSLKCESDDIHLRVIVANVTEEKIVTLESGFPAVIQISDIGGGTTLHFRPVRHIDSVNGIEGDLIDAEQEEASAVGQPVKTDIYLEGVKDGVYNLEIASSDFYDVPVFVAWLQSKGHTAVMSEDGTTTVNDVDYLPGNSTANILNKLLADCEAEYREYSNEQKQAERSNGQDA